MIFFHNRSAHAASHTRGHLDKRMMNVAVFDVFKRGYAVFYAVDRHISIAGSVKVHGFQNTARGREKSRSALLLRIHFFFKNDAFVIEPFGEFLVGQNGVDDSVVVGRLVLFCDARTDKHGFCARMTAFQIRTMRLHRRKYVGKIRKLFGEILLYEQIDGVAARGYDDISLFFSQKSVILVFDDGCAQRGFLDVRKTELFERGAHGVDAHSLIVCDEGRRKRHVNGIGLQKHSDFFGFVDDFLCVLRTHDEAVSAQNALVADNVRLIARKAYGFYGAMAYALIAVFAV